MKYATFLLITTIVIAILAIANNSGKSRLPHHINYRDDDVMQIQPERRISDRNQIRKMMEIEIVPLGTIPDDIDLDEWVHEIEYEIMSERCDDILETTHEIKKLVETKNGSATKK